MDVHSVRLVMVGVNYKCFKARFHFLFRDKTMASFGSPPSAKKQNTMASFGSPPPAKKQLCFESPHQSPKPGSSQADIVGYITLVGDMQRGRTNRFYDIKIQLPSGSINIRVMKSSVNFRDQLNKAVKLTSVSVPPDPKKGMYFYNEIFITL